MSWTCNTLQSHIINSAHQNELKVSHRITSMLLYMYSNDISKCKMTFQNPNGYLIWHKWIMHWKGITCCIKCLTLDIEMKIIALYHQCAHMTCLPYAWIYSVKLLRMSFWVRHRVQKTRIVYCCFCCFLKFAMVKFFCVSELGFF